MSQRARGRQRPGATRVQDSGFRRRRLRRFSSRRRRSLDTPLAEMRPAVLEKLFHGDGKDFPGLLTLLEQELCHRGRSRPAGTARRLPRPRDLSGLRRRAPAARSTRRQDRRAARSHEICRLSIADAFAFFVDLTSQLNSAARWGEGERGREGDAQSLPLTPSPSHPLSIHEDLLPSPSRILTEITARLGFLHKVGLDYLTLDRPADTLSGGELQRVRLATGIGSGLAGICYILDEPSIGLHPRDNQRLIDALRDLLGPRQHRPGRRARRSDDAPGRLADRHRPRRRPASGGQVVADGTPAEVMANPASITGRYLAARVSIRRSTRSGAKSPRRGASSSKA